jgi:hypothetical protein
VVRSIDRDVYSVLDRAIREGDSLPPYRTEKLVEVRHALDGCLVQCLCANVESASFELHERLYDRLTELYSDDWCTVSTNWDMHLTVSNHSSVYHPDAGEPIVWRNSKRSS